MSIRYKSSIFYKCAICIMAWKNYPLARMVTMGKRLKQKKYFCISMSGNSYGDNIKYLANYIADHETGAEIVWAFRSGFYSKADCPYKSVKLYTFKYYYHFLTSKYILSNARLNQRMLHKRKGQIYLQTWHGTALKKLGIDVKAKKRNRLQRWIKPDVFRFDVSNTDMMISGSRFMTNIYREKFGFNGPIEETGTPRNDIFFHDHPEISKKVRSFYNIPSDKQIILYAPTFRSDGSFRFYDIDEGCIMDCWSAKTGKACVFLVRLHPNLMRHSSEIAKMFPGSINASSYPDMQELLYASDLLITDYSSSMFDFMYTQKPVILYTPDRDTYDRGFYFDLEELPFMGICSNKDIESAIENFKQDEYEEKVSSFCSHIGTTEDGKASAHVYNLIKLH